MNTSLDYDVVIVGGGPIGLSAAYHCAKAGQSVLVLERFCFFNQSGSSNDLVRMFRTMYTEDFLADLAYEARDRWHELEQDSAEQLILMTGLLNFGDVNYRSGPEGNLTDPIKNLERLKLPYRMLKAEEVMRKYPFRDLPADYAGIFAPDNGCINVPLVLRTLFRLAQGYGAKLVSHARVLELRPDNDGVSVTMDTGERRTVRAGRCILACGAYSNDVLGSVGLRLKLDIWEMVYEYYATDPGPDGCYFPSMWFQFAEPTRGDPAKSNLFYGFPHVPWGPPNLVRIAVDNAVNVIDDPSGRKIVPAENDLAITAQFVSQHCRGVEARPNYCGSCLQTEVQDNLFVLDHLPPSTGDGYQNVFVFVGGWAFKFVPLFGQILQELTITRSSHADISHFTITRPGILVDPRAPAETKAVAEKKVFSRRTH
jgi:sarcosine oxidase / L-pipecolate oxidase